LSVRTSSEHEPKSFAFAVRAVKAYQYLIKERKEYVLSRQFLRSGTSIGANVEEAIGAQSPADFLSKMSIAYKEARETRYWIRLLEATEYFTEKQADDLLQDVDELLKIISSIKITTQNKIKNAKLRIKNS
jgi:four helix bundle protein